ncbi:MAG: dCTP deaminase [Candidatus Diapherotrites archaeon]|nr:dCTP deaminase [Candidatus Diapherotrites archaeon]
MAVLSDREIKKALKEGRIVIEGLQEENIGPASVDLTLGNEFRVFKHCEVTHVDTCEGISEELTEVITVPEGKPFIIHPNEFVLAVTREYVKVPADLMARLDGRSSLGRLGIIVHSTAGSIDPGFEGRLTLEMTNIARVPVQLWPGMKICRLTFETLTSESEVPYNKRKDSKYLGQKGPEISRIEKELKKSSASG